MPEIKSSELILNPDGSVYHLYLHEGQVARDIITVGDIERVDMITQYFDHIEFTVQNREFRTTTGSLNGKRLTVISTGIGTDNIDIVITELDALFNIDLKERMVRQDLTQLNFYRIGTSGALIEEVALDSYIVSAYAIGLDGLLHFYTMDNTVSEKAITHDARTVLKDQLPSVFPYAVKAPGPLADRFTHFCTPGITITNTGFYGPQGRSLRIAPRSTDFLDLLRNVRYEHLRTTNLEMETAGIYGLAHIFNHNAVSLNAIIANRALKTFTSNPGKAVKSLIEKALEVIAR